MPAPKKKETETDKTSLLILRRRGAHGDHPHHGGAWKIAYADFVTAMMAFFLLMWLLNSTNKSDKQGIADFFNKPLAIAMAGGKSQSASDSILNAGGKDLTTSTPAETRHGDDSKQQNPVLVPNATTQASPDQQAQQAAALLAATDGSKVVKPRTDPDDAQRLSELKERLDKMIEMNPKLAQFRNQIRIDITSEGLRIQIVDAQNRPMFASGKAVLEPYAAEILDQIGVALNEVENHISIAGHTDSAPYAGAESGYSNWELSSERANAARRELGVGGLAEQKVLQVRGLADALPLNKADPAEPSNRRISILVLNKRTEDAFFRDGGRTDLSAPGQIPGALGASKTATSTSATVDHPNLATNGAISPSLSTPKPAPTASVTPSPASSKPSTPSAPSVAVANAPESPEAVVARIKAAVSGGAVTPTPASGKTSAGGAIGAPGKTGAAVATTAVMTNQPAHAESGAGQ
jgi:chemotaxis protein MotB